MIIKITSGSGEASTELSAFDRALYNAGIGDYNLIRLSSVIPPDSEVIVEKVNRDPDRYGHKLYVVFSRCIETTIEKEAWAGLGWMTQDNCKGRGLFVEQSGSSEQEVERLISASLEDVVKYRTEDFGRINIKTEGIKCKGKPVCSIVAAVYRDEGW